MVLETDRPGTKRVLDDSQVILRLTEQAIGFGLQQAARAGAAIIVERHWGQTCNYKSLRLLNRLNFLRLEAEQRCLPPSQRGGAATEEVLNIQCTTSPHLA